MSTMVKKKKIVKKKKVAKKDGLDLRSGGVATKKKKKIRRRVKRKVEELDRLKAAAEEVTPAQRIQAGCRGFRLGFNSIPSGRTMKDDRVKLVRKEKDEEGKDKDVDVKANRDRLRLGHALFDRHPALTGIASAEGKIKKYFEAKTQPFPEGGVRLFMLETSHLDYDKMSEEEIEADYAKQIDLFSAEMRELIADYDAAVMSLMRSWPDVLVKAKAALKDLFKEHHYWAQDEIPSRLHVKFLPFNVDMPDYYNRGVSAKERQKVIASIEAQYQEAVRMQEEHIVKLFAENMDSMISSLTAYHNGETRRFTNGTVGKVFDALEEFKGKCQRYGILKGTALEQEILRVKEVMTDGLHTKDSLPQQLRDSSPKRENLVDRMDVLKNTILGLAERQKRRRLQREELSVKG